MPIEFLGIKDVALQLHCSHAFVYQLAHKNKITVMLIGKKLLFTQEAIDKYIQEHTLMAKEK
jgi:excisionase family DNA binding protein